MARYEHSRWSGARIRESLAGYGFIMPNFLGFLAFTSIPIIVSFYFAFTEYNVLHPPKFVGLRNFKDILGLHHEEVPVMETVTGEDGETIEKPEMKEVTDADGNVTTVPVTVRKLKANDWNFYYYFYNTVYLMLGIPLGMTLSLSMALIMNQKIRGITFWRTVFFLPSVTAGVAVYMLWNWIYTADRGLLNIFLHNTLGYLGLFPEDPTKWPQWLASATLADAIKWLW